jgi:hypothetical protein
VNNKHRIAVGIAALIGTLTILPAVNVDAANRPSPDYNKRPKPALVVDAYHRPSPDYNKRPKPAVVHLPCPAADDVPQCGLHVASNTTNVGSSAKSLRSPAVASGGGTATLDPARITPSPR